MLFSSRPRCAQTKRPNRGQFRPRLETLEDRLAPATFTVVNSNDSGAGSLRQAILDANISPNQTTVFFNIRVPDNIIFNIPGPGVHTISPLSPLPFIHEGVILDGTTQPGYTGSPLVQLDGAGAGSASGLAISAPNSTVRGLVISRFSSDGIRIIGAAATGNLVEKNYLGTNAAGTAAQGNGNFGVRIDNAANNKVVGNLISGNAIHGVLIINPGAAGNVVEGNYVGTNVSGNAPLPNLLSGVVIENGAHDNRIGTDGNGFNDAAERNVISGNGDFGVGIWRNVFDPTATTDTHHNIVAGNTIGLAPDGTTELGNGQDGVWINNARDNTIGGDSAAERNVISGNGTIPGINRGQNGIVIFNPGATGNEVAGNYIGTDAAGTAARPNRSNGVSILLGAHDNRIGTDGDGANDAAEGNLISGNHVTGVFIIGQGTEQNRVAGNLIGTDKTGMLPLANQGDGVFIGFEAKSNLIGPDADGVSDALERNVISGNRVNGVRIDNADFNAVTGSYVGTNNSATAALGNGAAGILIHNGAQSNVIGTSFPALRNTIAFNVLVGVTVQDAGTTGNQILGNAIYANGGLGIDLGADGVTPNDLGDADIGPNRLQNSPVLLPVQAGATTGVAGSLNSLANEIFTLYFYVNVDPSGFGEGQRFLGTHVVTTDGRGNASFSLQFDAGSVGGQVITATATDSAGNTSEFSAGVVVSPPLFGVQTPFAVGIGPVSVAVADFDGDGSLDLATANSSSHDVSVRLSDDAGGFKPATNLPVSSFPRSVAVGDFNRDSIPDLATASSYANHVSVLLGNGLGGFDSATNFPVSGAHFLAVGDFNRDGNPDLAAVNFTGVSVLLGNGLGSFATPTEYTAGSQPVAIAVGDFNRDGNPDLAVANQASHNVDLLLGNGAGGFGAGASFPVGSGPDSVAVGDFNRDGNSDLAVANKFSNTVSVRLGNGLGGFGSATNFPTGFGSATNFPTGFGPRSVAVGDFNRDGNPDLATANDDNNNVSVLLGSGAGSFGATANFAVGARPGSLAVGDFNRDGALDLVAANTFSRSVSVLLNQSPVTTTLVSSNPSPSVVGQLVTFSATVTPALPGALTPTGIVTFMDGTHELGTGTLDVNGQASVSTFALTTGYHTITAV